MLYVLLCHDWSEVSRQHHKCMFDWQHLRHMRRGQTVVWLPEMKRHVGLYRLPWSTTVPEQNTSTYVILGLPNCQNKVSYRELLRPVCR